MPPPLPAPCAPRRRGAHGGECVRAQEEEAQFRKGDRVSVREKRLTARGGSGRAPNPLRAPVRRRPPPLREGPAEGGSRQQPPPCPGGQGEQEVVGHATFESSVPLAGPGSRRRPGRAGSCWPMAGPGRGACPQSLRPGPAPGSDLLQVATPGARAGEVRCRCVPPRGGRGRARFRPGRATVLHCSHRPRRPRPPLAGRARRPLPLPPSSRAWDLASGRPRQGPAQGWAPAVGRPAAGRWGVAGGPGPSHPSDFGWSPECLLSGPPPPRRGRAPAERPRAEDCWPHSSHCCVAMADDYEVFLCSHGVPFG